MALFFRIRFGALIIVALAAVIVAGCGSSEDAPTVERDADGLPVARVAARYATALADDPDTLANAMDTAFSGEVIAEGQDRYARIGNGREQSLPVSVFLVRVEDSTGQPAVGSLIKVEQLGGVSSGGEVRVLLDGDAAMAVGARYLFVARQDGPDTFSAPAFARFPIEDDRLTAPPGWEETGASQALTGITPTEAIERLASQ